MDAESFLEFASQVTKWKMYPYFDVAHSVLCALHVRDDLGPGNRKPSSAVPAFYIRVSNVDHKDHHYCLWREVSNPFGVLCRCAGFFPETPHLLLAVHHVGGLRRRHAERRVARRTAPGAVEKHSTAGDRLGCLVMRPSAFY